MLLSFVALVGLFNAIMLGISDFTWAHGHIPFPHSLNNVLGVVGAPVAWLIGIPWHDCRTIGNLLGTRTIINEFLAFKELGNLKATLDPRSFSIATFALCGFANVGSIGMQIGGIGSARPQSPERTSLNSASAPCSRAQWPTSCPPSIVSMLLK